MRTIGWFTAMMFLVLPHVACEDGSGPSAQTFSASLSEGNEPHERFRAPSLSGENEVPAVTTDATGSATFTLNGSTLSFTLDVADIDNVSAAHIHRGAEGENGGVMVGLFEGPTTDAGFTGTLAEGTVEIHDSVAAHMRDGTAYVNVHTTENPGGEIRDQIAGVGTGATGSASFVLSGNILDFELTVADIDDAIAAHIHLGQPGEAGPVLVPLFAGPATDVDFSGLLAEGSVAIADSVIVHMRAGNTYVNVHTLANPAGAIRGQIE